VSRSVVVTGAAGFVGASVVARLATDERNLVTAVVRNRSSDCYTGCEPVYAADLAAPDLDFPFLRGASVVVHLANRVHVPAGSPHVSLAEFRRVNVAGTINLARRAAARGVQRLVYVSSIGVNGNRTGESPFRETDPPSPQEPYAQSKWEAEQGLRSVEIETGMEVVIIRPPLVHGPDAPGNFGRLLRLVRSGIPLPFGMTRNRRSLIGIDNLVDFILVCMDHPAASGENFVVSDGEDVSTPDLVRGLASSMGRPALLVPIPLWLMTTGASVFGMQDTVQSLLGSLQVDAGKAHRMLNWRPPVSLDEGLRRSVQALGARAP
jgi:nucleoside-diphosphate-sugar epimerase